MKTNTIEKLEAISLDLEKIEAYNNLLAHFLEDTIAEATISTEEALLFLNNIKKDANNFLILDYTLKDTLEAVKKEVDTLIEENLK